MIFPKMRRGRAAAVARYLTGRGIVNTAAAPTSGGSALTGPPGYDIAVRSTRGREDFIRELRDMRTSNAPITIKVMGMPGVDIESSICLVRLDQLTTLIASHEATKGHR